MIFNKTRTFTQIRTTLSPCTAMSEVLGKRSLLGIAVVLIWLVLFHLLVNLWLLCVFTSLLVVLGGWLGSQAVLESKNIVHLERFITLKQVLSSVEDEQNLDKEIHSTVRKIIRDFVNSWYSSVSSESGFEIEVQEAMIVMAMELKMRARQIDRKELTRRILDLFGSHLQDYITAKELVIEQETPLTGKWGSESQRLWKAFSNVATPHLAMASDTVKLNYTRAVVDMLLHVLVPSVHLESRTGRFVVGELITCNVFLPLIAKLSDPDWLNLLVTDFFEKSSVTQLPIATELLTSSLPPSSAPHVKSELTPLQDPQKNADGPLPGAKTEIVHVAQIPELSDYHVVDLKRVDSPHSKNEDEENLFFQKHYMRGSKPNPFYQENDFDVDSRLPDCNQRSTDFLFMIDQREVVDKKQNNSILSDETSAMNLGVCSYPVDGPFPEVQVDSEHVEHQNGCVHSPSKSAETVPFKSKIHAREKADSSLSVNPNKDLLLYVEQTGLGNHNELSVVSNVSMQVSSTMPSFSFDPLCSPEGPAIIQNLRITGTITAKEHRGTGSHPYTLYTIKYETALGCDKSIQSGSEDADILQSSWENPSSIQPVAYHTVNRRYSEFLNLQTRLEEKVELRKLVKGVKGPKKIFPDMPFGNMDSDKIEARKGLLETFLKQLCAIPEIVNSEEMQEFLALNTDARIAFVKKPFIVSRIDKIVVNAIVDTLKTAFPRSEPQSPTEENESEVDGGKISADKKNKSRLKLSSKNNTFMNGSDVKPQVLFSCEQSSTMFNRMSLEELQGFITEQEKLVIKAETMREDSPVVSELSGCMDDTLSEKFISEHGAASEMGLAEVALNILCLLMREQWSWLCTENIQRTTRLLFGTLIDRWLDVNVANLTCTRYWVVYLQVIQEAVWPGGVLRMKPQLERSQQQKDATRQHALHCLMRFLPDLVLDMLGSDNYKRSWQTVLESLQNPYINRHLIYCIFDLLLEFIVPEIPEVNFQRNLLQTLSKNPENTLA
ncbi:sorting nexin-19 isoform X2 [Betta splendens]|uniref:Sorting nexin-19 isoform X2 n=1 Tax=Betta splendens TaxID=158456 RepID=A0A6P7P7X4_BETSP|nr:sorting nexin-19 isoform X2 [Betta splendens]